MTSGISHRVIAIAANAELLGQGQPLRPRRPARDELGRLTKALVHAEELLASRTAELVAARDSALSATQSKNAFLSSTSHEIRTPLNAILGFTQLLEMSDLSPDDRDGVERILVAGRHLLALINELIDISRIESGELSLSVEPVLVRPMVEEICQLMTALAAARSITVSQGCLRPDLAVLADQQRLRQILVNLVSNAIKYNRRGGTVSIACQAEEDGRVSLVVDRHGAGDPGGRPGADLRPVRTARRRADRDRGHRHRPAAGPGPRPGHGRPAHRVQHPRRRIGLHRHAPARRRALDPGTGRRAAAGRDRARRAVHRGRQHPVHRGQPGEHRGRQPVSSSRGPTSPSARS